MRIQINEDERYEIKMPESITSVQQLDYLISRLTYISKLINKQSFSQGEITTLEGTPASIIPIRKDGKNEPRHYTRRVDFTNLTKEKVIQYLKIYYSDKPSSEKDIELKKQGVSIALLYSHASKWKKRFAIKPKDVGLNNFFTRGEKQVSIPIRTRKKSNEREWCNTREKYISILKMHYFGTREQKNDMARKFGFDSWNDISKAFYGLQKRYAIKPQEVGLRYFPNMRGKDVNIDQARIK